MKTYFFPFLLAVLSFNAFGQYTLNWSDEFNGTQIDPTKWVHEIGGHGWGNNELQYYTSSSANSFLGGGYLHIKAIKEQLNGNAYTSARLITKGLYSLKYGKIEAKIKLPMGIGSWPAFWMLGDNISSVSWPACGEIDIMEHIGNEGVIHGTIHYDSLGHKGQGASYSTDVTQWHVYGLEWSTEKLTWYLDGVKFFETSIQSAGRTEFQESFYFLLNLAIGGSWPGSPNATTVFPMEMLVDFVRVYKKAVAETDELTEDDFSISPNPAYNELTITNNTNEPLTYRIFTTDGKEVFVAASAAETALIDLSFLTEGTYTIQLTSQKQQTTTKRFIKL